MGEYAERLNEISKEVDKFAVKTEVENPKVSVIVPVYNVEKYLEKCLFSIIKQTLKDIEIILVDDGSNDFSPDIINAFAQTDKRIIAIRQDNAGPSKAKNEGLKIAKGEYITFIDSDDWINEEYLEKLLDAIERNSCDIAAATIIRKRAYTQKYRVHYTEEKVYSSLEDKIAISRIPESCYVWNKLYRHEKIKDYKFAEGVFFEDVLWIPEVLKNIDKLVTVPNANYYYRVNNSSIVKKTPSKKKQKDSYNSKKYIIKFFNENNLKLSKKSQMLTKEIKYFFNIPILKVKEFEVCETYLLFGFLKLFSVKQADNRMFYNIYGIKITLRKNKLSNNEYKKLNYEYENGKAEIPKVKNKYETLEELINTNKSIARFGDGEFNLIFGEDLPFQKYNDSLARRLKEILISDNENVLVALPDIFGKLDEYNDNAATFWRKFIAINRAQVYSSINLDKQYYDTETTRPYMDLKDKSEVKEYFERFKQVWQDKDVVFVEGEASRLGYKNNLFSNAKSMKRIICPAKNAFDKYDKILAECKKQEKNVLFIIALGPTATLLAYDLANLGYRALDMGHIDIEYEWFLRKAIKKIPIKDKYVNETRHGKVVTHVYDKEYLSQIVANFTEKNQ